MTGHEHNWWVAFTRLWGAIAAHEIAAKVYARGPYAEIARELAAFETRRYAAACYALGTTTAALEADKEIAQAE